ncbi:MAG: hypothetical protein Q9195_002674 [Heterodermia aff. obscurata]
MSELSKLVEDLHLEDDRNEESTKRGTKEEDVLRHALGSGTQRLLARTSVGNLNFQCGPCGHASRASLGSWNSVPHIEDLQQNLLDPTSHVFPCPPLNLGTRVAAMFDDEKEKSSCVPQRTISLDDRHIGSKSAKLTRAQPIPNTTPSPATSELESTMYLSRPQAPTPSKAYHGIIESDWEALVADADQRFEHQSGDDPTWEAGIRDTDGRFENEPSVMTVIHRQQCNQTNNAPQPVSTEQKYEGLECCSITPIPLDYNKPRAPRTPSIHSQGSVLDCTSPSFPKSAKAKLDSILKDKELNGLTAWNLRKVSDLSKNDSQLNGHVEEWLENTESAECVEEMGIFDEIGENDDEKASFPVWPQIEEEGMASSAHGPQGSSQLALRDMTNLQQPRYLEKNSFFQNRENSDRHSPVFIPSPARAADYERSLAILEGRHRQHVRDSVPTRSRSAEFQNTLAFLEGRR